MYSAVTVAFGALVLAIVTTEFSAIKSFVDVLNILSNSFLGSFGVVFLM